MGEGLPPRPVAGGELKEDPANWIAVPRYRKSAISTRNADVSRKRKPNGCVKNLTGASVRAAYSYLDCGLQLSRLMLPHLAKWLAWRCPFRASMFAQDFAIIGASGLVVAGMAFWLVWLWRHVQ
jgi:hypothetical protein